MDQRRSKPQYLTNDIYFFPISLAFKPDGVTREAESSAAAHSTENRFRSRLYNLLGLSMRLRKGENIPRVSFLYINPSFLPVSFSFSLKIFFQHVLRNWSTSKELSQLMLLLLFCLRKPLFLSTLKENFTEYRTLGCAGQGGVVCLFFSAL